MGGAGSFFIFLGLVIYIFVRWYKDTKADCEFQNRLDVAKRKQSYYQRLLEATDFEEKEVEKYIDDNAKAGVTEKYINGNAEFDEYSWLEEFKEDFEYIYGENWKNAVGDLTNRYRRDSRKVVKALILAKKGLLTKHFFISGSDFFEYSDSGHSDIELRIMQRIQRYLKKSGKCDPIEIDFVRTQRFPFTYYISPAATFMDGVDRI